MIIEGRTIATILIYIFTFLGYLLGRSYESEKTLITKNKIKILKELVAKHRQNSGK